jgi:hypothetical protein
VLVTGGSDRNGELATAELFDPTTGMFTLTTGNMETKRSNHTATLLSNGNVLVTGGDVPAVNPNSRVSPTAELFDPTAGTFTPTGSMTSPRAYQAATLLNDGTVFVLGGEHLVAKGVDLDLDRCWHSFNSLYQPTIGPSQRCSTPIR